MNNTYQNTGYQNSPIMNQNSQFQNSSQMQQNTNNTQTNDVQSSFFYEPNSYQQPAPYPLKTRKTLLPWFKSHDQCLQGQCLQGQGQGQCQQGINQNVVQQIPTQRIQRWENEQSMKRFRDFFDYQNTEQLWGEYHCYCLHKKGVFPVTIFISTNWLSMIYDNMQTRKLVHIKIALRSIVSIQNAITIQRKGELPLLQLVAQRKTRSDAIQIYTNDSCVHLFYRFFNEKNYEFFNVLEKCWRACFMTQPNYDPHLPGMPPQSPYDNLQSHTFMNNHPNPNYYNLFEQQNSQIYPQTNLGSQMNPHMNPQNQMGNVQSQVYPIQQMSPHLQQQNIMNQSPRMSPRMQHQQIQPQLGSPVIHTVHHIHQSPVQTNPHLLVNPENLYTNQINSNHDIMEPKFNSPSGRMISQQQPQLYNNPYYCYETSTVQGSDTGFPKEYNY